VQRDRLPPMAGGSWEQCHDVICIEAKQVCDFCFQEHRVERTFVFDDLDAGRGRDKDKDKDRDRDRDRDREHHHRDKGKPRPVVECEIDEQDIVCRVVERRTLDRKKSSVLVCLAIEVPVFITIGNETRKERIVFLKQAVLCAPADTDIECQVTGNCCCFFDVKSGTISCVFVFCVIIQSKVNVRVLVPILGFCAPKECEGVAGGCPPGIPQPCDDCHPFRKDRRDDKRDRSSCDCDD
jgi:hypothetical protein